MVTRSGGKIRQRKPGTREIKVQNQTEHNGDNIIYLKGLKEQFHFYFCIVQLAEVDMGLRK